VALSRHRENVVMFYGQDDFSPEWSKASPANNLMATLSRARTKELAHDYLDRDQVGDLHPVGSSERVVEQRATGPATITAAERLRQRSDEVARRLAAEREQERTAAAAIEQQRTQEHQHYPTVERDDVRQRERELNKDYDQGLEL
jgi:hypothetical protein